MQNRICALMLGFLFIFIVGCSKNGSQVVSPEDETSYENEIPYCEKSDTQTSGFLVGLWEMQFDSSSMNILVAPARDLAAHMNVKSFIPAPTVQVIWFDPLTGILNADVTFQNPSSLNIHDMRIIVYSDNYGFRLMNPDDYTDLFDISGGSVINPFKTYANGEWHKCFYAYKSQTARLQLYFPTGSASLNFAVDVSYPGNCTEPYLISNFTSGNLEPITSSTAIASVKVYDWQYNVDSVEFWCPSVTGQNTVPFIQKDLYTWETTITNTLGAKEGTYTGVIIAGSADSGSQMLYDLVHIQVERFKPFVVHSMGILYGASDIDISGNYAYITGYNSELIIADISNPVSPFITSILPTTEDPLYVKVNRGFAFLREGESNLRIVSVDDPYDPGEVNTLFTVAEDIRNFDVSGNYVYVGAGWDGLIVVDVRDKRAPMAVGFMNLSDFANSVTLSGFIAFVGTYSGFAIIDVRTPSSPQLVNHYVDGSWVEHCVINGNTLYTAGGGLGGFSIFDVTDPMAIILKSRLDMSIAGTPHELYYRDNCVFSSGDWALRLFDVAVPENPIVTDIVAVDGAYRLAIKDDYAFVADIFFGMRVIQLYQH